MRIAALDQGTTSTRVLVASQDGSADIQLALRHQQHHPQSGWVEHDPLELLANLQRCLEASGRVDAIGLANQGESCMAWDARSGEPLSPLIVWQDNRTTPHIERLRASGAEALVLERSGLPLDAYFSASKLGWIVEHLPAARRALKAGRLRLGTSDAWFLDRLCGTFATDVTTASRTALMNLAEGRWDPDLCALFGVPIECLPEIRDTVGHFGVIGNTPLTASVVDQQASLYGHGCRQPGDAKITFGTGAFALTLSGERIIRSPETGLLATIAWQIDGKPVYAMDGGSTTPAPRSSGPGVSACSATSRNWPASTGRRPSSAAWPSSRPCRDSHARTGTAAPARCGWEWTPAPAARTSARPCSKAWCCAAPR